MVLFYGVDSNMEFGEGLKKLLTERIGSKLPKYSEDAEAMEPTGGWKGKQDAARHLLAVGDIARKSHPLVAKTLANLHEWVLDIGASTDDLEMDKHNNELALTLFNAKSYDEVKSRVAKMMETANYNDYTDKSKPVFIELPQEGYTPDK